MALALPQDSDYAGRVALITGGSGAIGLAIGERLTSLGAEVVHVSRSAISCSRRDSDGIDVRDADAVRALLQWVKREYGRLDLLVNNAGIMVRHGPLATSASEWVEVLATNLTGAFQMSCAAFEALSASDRAAIVNVTSTHGHLAAKGSTAYSVSKAGLNHLTRLLALEWADARIRVNAVAPTVVPSAMTSDVLGDPEYVTRKLAAIPLGQPISTADVAAAVAFLGSPAAASITGHVLVLDGGEGLP